MTAATVDELLTRELRNDRPSLVDATGREFDHHWLCTTAWKSGNFLRHSGVRKGVTVGIAGENPLSLLAFFGTTLLEGTTRFDPPADLTDVEDFRALVAPVRDLESETYDLPRGAQRIGYGTKPEQPDIHHFDAGVWTENPAFPPLDIDSETTILTDGERTVSHADALAAASDVVETHGLEEGDRVVVREPLSDPKAVAAGVLAPLLADGVIVLTGDERADGQESAVERGEYAVSSESVPEPTRIELDAVSLP
ncbi:hypothetical protein [Natronolimnohabitans innermongolicus]|uniref:AMP-dependent synthetase and ligase n=1 Tax=Natronolimnohabitans innermongolicus JCM 12255 TaxID=1227499 RepID=L9X7Z2_9EURY|nr:hypothetical protein [Natronolimnohabitans innermongolicus]ELY57727.1 hypothetical protein C493_07544 [Natronolimnohabitans innermongolicus JCM 12255]